jgi:ABC-type nitrate/sulfonate/bicarbonate transport system substrate-binding protein
MNLARVSLALISEGMATTWPVYVAQSLGLFEREGIAVDVTVTGSSVKQLDALKAGVYDIGFQQADHIVRAVEQGSDLFIFMSTARAPELTFVAAPDVTSFTDLRHRSIAVDGARSGYALLLRKLLASKGLEGEDYRFNEIGGSQERYDAMRQGRSAASLLNSPFDRNLLASGYNTLGTTTQYFPRYPGPIAASRRSWAARHASELRAFIRAMLAAFVWLRVPANRDAAIALLPAHLHVMPVVAADAYAQFAAHPVPEITDEGLEQVVSVVWDAERLAPPQGAPRRYADASYIEAARG